VASISYRTVLDGATWRDSLADVKSAIRYLGAHTEQYDINPDKVALWGQSAGGYLAAMAGTTNGEKQFDVGGDLDESSDVQAVGHGRARTLGSFQARCRLRRGDTGGQKHAREPSGQVCHRPGTGLSALDDPVALRAADPATYISSRAPRFIELHGSHDRFVSPSQTLLLHTALRAKDIPSTRYVLRGADHGDSPFLGEPGAGIVSSTQEVMGIIVDFLAEHLSN
jgi:acetyl esterase/lipase